MRLMTKAQEELMIRNYERNSQNGGGSMDDKPVIKLFTPWAQATWYFSEYDPANGLFFGLCDLGMGFPEMGYASKDELEALQGPAGLRVERDLYTTLKKSYNELLAEQT